MICSSAWRSVGTDDCAALVEGIASVPRRAAQPSIEIQRCAMAENVPCARETRSCTSGLELDLDEDHLGRARVEHLVLDAGGPRIADAAREIREDLLTVRHHPKPTRGYRHDHVVVLVAMRAGGGARRQAIAGD